ncbi:TadE/TadG family type IV pilus assembly protein [Georgenia yuyongxinii]|uniref:Pilus assembly protein n=1 Tax=Georgenia yuyongxinii TaxID=2589797 RepID=A0A552WX76_9MICO|nr:TadE family protein [Georgenia yuyongxinii]TRW47441.1 pilus assembly protein [Georgenia yuyongxinii]
MSRTKPPRSAERRPTCVSRRRAPRRWRDQRGSTSVEMVIVLPALFVVMFLGVQAALYYHARSVVIAAATQGATAAAVEQGTLADGLATAGGFIADAGGDDVVTGVNVGGDRSATTATVWVEGHALSVLPGWAPTVRQSASIPVERITAP